MIFFWAHRSVLSNLPVIKSLGKHLINDLCLCFVSVFHTVGIYFTLQRKFFFFLEHLTFHNRFQRRYYSSNELIWCYLVANNFLEVLIVRQSVKCRPIFFLFFFFMMLFSACSPPGFIAVVLERILLTKSVRFVIVFRFPVQNDTV